MEIQNPNILNVIIAGMSLVSTIFTGVMAYLMLKLKNETREQTETLQMIDDTSNKTHVLANSSYGAQLKLLAITSRKLATATGDKSDLEAATITEQLLAEHERALLPGYRKLEDNKTAALADAINSAAIAAAAAPVQAPPAPDKSHHGKGKK